MSEQLELFGGDLLLPHRRPADHCVCGAALVGSINAYRRLCDRCILHKTIAGHVWCEDPEPKREHLQRWLQERA